MLYKDRLARDLLRDLYGEMVEKVGDILLTFGRQTLQQIIFQLNEKYILEQLQQQKTSSASAVPTSTLESIPRYDYVQVRNALLIMIQHNLVEFLTEEEMMHRNNSKTLDEDGNVVEATSNTVAHRAANKQANKKPKSTLQAPSQNTTTSTSSSTNNTTTTTSTSSDEDGTIYYEISPENIIIRLRFPKFILLVKNKYKQEGEYIMEGLTEHGSITLGKLMDDCVQRSIEQTQREQGYDFTSEELNTFVSATRRRYLNIFNEMVKDRYLRRRESKVKDLLVDASGNFLGTANKETNQKVIAAKILEAEQDAEKKKKKKKKKEEETQEEETDDKKKKKRKRKDTKGEEEEESEEGKKKKKKKKTTDLLFDEEESSTTTTSVFDQTSTTTASSSDTLDQESRDVLWELNLDQFIRIYRSEAIIRYVSLKLDASCAKIIRAMINISSAYQRKKNEDSSTMIKFSDVSQALMEMDEQMSGNVIFKNLERMASSQVGFLQNLGGGQGSYTQSSFSINLGFIAGIIKKQSLENVIEQRFGIIGSRIFRILLAKGQLEQKQIAEFAMVPVTEARTILYHLYQDGMVQLQEVPKSTDHHPTRTFYLWHVNISQVYSTILENLYKSIRNLRLRLVKEQRDALQLLGGNLILSTNLNHLSVQQQQYIKHLETIEDRLESSILHLADVIMQLEDF